MVEDIWTYHPLALNELILNALETADFDLLRGIQAFSEVTRWTHIAGMESIINTLFEKTMEMHRQAQDLQTRLTENEAHYRELGAYDSMAKRLEKLSEKKIPFFEMKNICADLSAHAFLENINFLEEHGFIETDRKGDWDVASMWLPRRYWGELIWESIPIGKESSIFTSALATMIAHASQKETLSIIKATVNALNSHSDGNIAREEFEQYFRMKGISIRKLYNFIERDAYKADDIKAFSSDDGRVLTFSRGILLANQRWIERAQQIALTRRMSV